VAALRYVTFGLLSLIILVSFESFNSAFSGLSASDAVRQGSELRPQIAAMALWLLLMLLSFIPRVASLPLRTKGLQWPALLLAWAVLSSFWSDDPLNAMPKAAVLLVSSLAAWRTTSIVTVEEMFACIYYNIAFMLLVSLVLVAFVPEIGVVQLEWQHVGNWQGVFATKQGLGMASAVFLGIVLLRIARRRTLFDLAMCGVGLLCLIKSESRGAGVMAFVAVAFLFVGRKHPKLAGMVSGILLLDLMLAVADISYFTTTGEASIHIFGYDINFTERTFIWQYALSLWPDRPFLGYGLNGFWTNSNVYYAYLRLHGWVLDNYHSGYLAIIVETGVVGFGLFAVVAFQLMSKLRTLMLTVHTHRFSLEMSAGFLLMFFTINLTETYFLRSTNFLAVFFTFLIVKILSAPAKQAQRRITLPGISFPPQRLRRPIPA
jgi:O-antigen ligase